MFNVLIKLQRKPETVRKRIALLCSIAITGVIVLVWLASLTATESATTADAKEEVTPFAALREGVSALWNDTGKTVREVSAAFSTFRKQEQGEPTAETAPRAR